jgi:hypothetical protein
MATVPNPGPTVRDRQQAAVTALADLLTRDLPPLYWRVMPYAGAEHLRTSPPGDDETALSAMRAWALALGAEIVATTHDDHVEHVITAEHMGAVICIYAHTSVAYGFERVAKEATR